MSEESIKKIHLHQTIVLLQSGLLIIHYRKKINGDCLIQDSVSFLHKNVVNLYVNYKLVGWTTDLNTDFTLGHCCCFF